MGHGVDARQEWPHLSLVEDGFPAFAGMTGMDECRKTNAAVREHRRIVTSAYQTPPLYHEVGSNRVVKKSLLIFLKIWLRLVIDGWAAERQPLASSE